MKGLRSSVLKDEQARWLKMLLIVVESFRARPRTSAAERETLYSKGTVGLKLTVLRVFYKMALSRQCVFENPALGVKGPRDNTRRADRVMGRLFSDEEFIGMMRACPKNDPIGIRNRCILALARVQGLRISDVVGLNVEDYTPSAGEAGTLTIVARTARQADGDAGGGKGDKSRTVGLDTRMKPYLDAWLAVRDLLKPNTPALFVTMHRGGRPDGTPPGERLHERGLRAMFDLIQRDLGLKRAGRSFHGLRHSFATRAIGEGADLGHVSHMMGHSSVVVTEVYVDVNEIQRDNPAKFAGRVLDLV